MLDSIMNPILSPLLILHPFWALLIVSFILSIIITYIYKWTTDQDLMKGLKGDIKKNQDEMKKLKDNPKKMMKAQKKIMDSNLKYMKHSMKPTLYTFIPIILILGWLSTHMAYYPIMPGEEFIISAIIDENYEGDVILSEFGDNQNVQILSDSSQDFKDNPVMWTLKAEEGIYILNIQTNGEIKQKKVIVTEERNYENSEVAYRDGNIQKIITIHEKIIPMKNIFLFNKIPWISGFGWLGTYIIFSIIFSIVLRKMMGLS